jgi:hypothetical protein
MRRIPASLGGVALATSLLVSPAAAARAQHISDTESFVFCHAESDAGTVSAFAVASESFGSFADLTFWAPGTSPEFDDPTWISVMGSAEFQGMSATATFELVEFVPSAEDPFGDPVGTATLDATLTAAGDPQPYSIDESSGNHKFRRDGVLQESTGEGTLNLPEGISFSESECVGGVDTFTAFANQPASFVNHFTDFSLSCGWELDESFVNLFASVGSFGGFSDLVIFGEEDVEFFGVSTGSMTLTTQLYEDSFDVFDAQDPGTGDPVGSADASATLTESGSLNEHFSFGNTKVHITGTTFAVDGSLTLVLPEGTHELAMDAESCFAADQRITEQSSARQGPKGRPLANDAPEGALPIAIGEEVTVKTLGTAFEPEAPCLSEDGGDFPMSKSAWWTFEGTGGDVTIDTAGSDFDTIVGVYVDEGGELVPIGCVDDVDGSLQAMITVATDAGVTYWIQAGGFAGDSGTLVLSVN